jgi:hypothetical protein
MVLTSDDTIPQHWYKGVSYWIFVMEIGYIGHGDGYRQQWNVLRQAEVEVLHVVRHEGSIA